MATKTDLMPPPAVTLVLKGKPANSARQRAQDLLGPTTNLLGSVAADVLKALLEAKEAKEPIGAYIRAYRMMRDWEDMLAAQLKQMKAVIEEMKLLRLPELFDQYDVKTQTLADTGDRVSISEHVLASIRADMKERAFKWLRDNGHGSLIQETVNSSTLAAFAGTMLEENKEMPDEIFNVSIQQRASLTRGKGPVATKKAKAAAN